MADSEVRQKFEAWKATEKVRVDWILPVDVFAAGMRAGEIARSEMKPFVKEALTDAMESRRLDSEWLPDAIERAEIQGKTRDAEKYSRWKAEADEAVAQIAEFLLPAAPEEKKA